ncbi:MAG: hypothetical protein ABI705_14035 [Aestuariivirga sp.]
MTSGVAANYVHRDKVASPGEGIATGGSQLKWSNIAPAEASVPKEIEKLARDYLKDVRVAGDLGFVILHRCGEDFYFLLVSTWRNENELWESVYAKANADEPDFKPYIVETAHRGTFCVWELGVVWHEQQAWKRFLMSKRATGDVTRYLNDRFEGSV